MTQVQDRARSRRQRTDRLRRRVAQIKPEDHDMIELVAVLKGIIDMIDDDEMPQREHVRT